MSSAIPSKPSVRSLNHLKLPSSDIAATVNFYTQILPFVYIPKYDHLLADGSRFAAMFHHPQMNLLIEARYNPTQAKVQKGWDPITFGVGDRNDLEDWIAWLDSKGVERSKIFFGVKGWVLCCRDPDGRVVRFYVEDEEHEWSAHPDLDAEWMGETPGEPADKTGKIIE